MFRSRLIALLAATVVVVVLAGSSLATSKAQSAYVTDDDNCQGDLQVNQLADLSDAYVYLKQVTTSQINYDLVWTLWQGGVQIDSGDFTYVCTLNSKYKLAWPNAFPSGGEGTYTLKVDWDTGVNYSGDSFAVD